MIGRKNSLVMTDHSFLVHEYSFFKLFSRLGALPTESYQSSAPDPKLQLLSLLNRFFPYKTQSSSLKRASVNVLG